MRPLSIEELADKPLQMLLRFRADVINLKPVGVVILAGGNGHCRQYWSQPPEMILNNIYSMVELAEAKIQSFCACFTGKLFLLAAQSATCNNNFSLESIQRYAKEKDCLYRLLFFTSRQSERIAPNLL
jgi:hypothetical protein